MSSNTQSTEPGTLWVVGTPLGNPGDLSPRARACLEEAELVLAEDTKREGLACARWGVEVRRFEAVRYGVGRMELALRPQGDPA